jgi:hypothetical protein
VSLKGRLRSLEARAAWLERWGELRQVERELKYRHAVAQAVDHLTANPTAAARLGVADMVAARPGRSASERLSEAVVRARARVEAATAHAATGPPESPAEESPSESPRDWLPEPEVGPQDPPDDPPADQAYYGPVCDF